MSFPIFSAINNGLSGIKTALDTLGDIKTSIDALSLSSSVTVGQAAMGIGGTTWQGELDGSGSPTTVIYDGELQFLTGTYLWRGQTSGDYDMGTFEVADSPAIIYRDGIPYIQIVQGSTLGASVSNIAYAEDVDLILNFTSFPLVSGGIIGPQGATGLAGPAGDGWGAWSNIVYSASCKNQAGFTGKYRSDPYNTQITALIAPTSTWTMNAATACFTLPIANRPLYQIDLSSINSTRNPEQIVFLPTGEVRLYPQITSGWISLNCIIPLT